MGEENKPVKQAGVEKEQTRIRSAAEPGLFLLPAVPTPKLPPLIPNPSMPMPTQDDAGPTAEGNSKSKGWNTSRLGLRIGADAVAAGAAGVLVAPIITAIDKGIIENASGRNTLGDSLRASFRQMVWRPAAYFGSRPFGLIFVGSGFFCSIFGFNVSSMSIPSCPTREEILDRI
jgi:hypothetical protein